MNWRVEYLGIRWYTLSFGQWCARTPLSLTHFERVLSDRSLSTQTKRFE